MPSFHGWLVGTSGVPDGYSHSSTRPGLRTGESHAPSRQIVNRPRGLSRVARWIAPVVIVIEIHTLPVVVDRRADVTHSAENVPIRRPADFAARWRFQDDTEVRPGRSAVDRFRRADSRDRPIGPSAHRRRLFVMVVAVPRAIDLVLDHA